MDRRNLLEALTGTLAVGLTGCSALEGTNKTLNSSPGTPTGEPTNSQQARLNTNERKETSDGESNDGRPATIHDSLVIPGKAGDDSTEIQPHTVRLYNEIDGERAIGLTLVPQDGDGPLGTVSASFDVAAGEGVGVELQHPATYSITVTVAGTIVTQFDLNDSWFDCNNSATNIELGAHGDVDRTEITTFLDCTNATVEKPDDSE